MNELAHLLAFVLAAIGLAVLLVWPQDGPGAWLRERLLRRLLPPKLAGLLDCYICCGFWIGNLLAPLWWFALYREPWCWLGGPITSAAFWLFTQPRTAGDNT